MSLVFKLNVARKYTAIHFLSLSFESSTKTSNLYFCIYLFPDVLSNNKDKLKIHNNLLF